MSRCNAVGIDIGGAYTKVASTSGRTKSFYFPLWKENSLSNLLCLIKKEFDPENVGVVMTAELADVFASKKEGVHYIASCVRSVFEHPYFFSMEGRFSQIIDDQRWNIFAASNWKASAIFVGARICDCIFVDIGSTTCDVIPIEGGKPLASTTDFQRLCKEELIYMGVLRTPLAALLHATCLNGRSCHLSSELYAITADVYRILGNISDAQYSCHTPDDRPRDLCACMQRVARMFLCDVDELGREQVVHIARSVERIQVEMLATALAKHIQEYGLRPIVGAGLGEFIVAKAAEMNGFKYRSLAHLCGEHVAEVLPAYATAQLLLQTLEAGTM
jgi:(4-(4-[2-(gamma-L-glutamylamino)ethyl]phenoxymethyl)furan-2-yl)methanamine synthase